MDARHNSSKTSYCSVSSGCAALSSSGRSSCKSSRESSRKSSSNDAPSLQTLVLNSNENAWFPTSGRSSPPIDEFRVEAWLDEHPDFVADYFLRKAKRDMVDSWLVSRALSHHVAVQQLHQEENISNGSVDPCRKISGHDFDSVGERPILSTSSDGSRTFITSYDVDSMSDTLPNNKDVRSNNTRRNLRRPRRLSELRNLDERQLMYELIFDICHDLEVTSLCFKILRNVCVLVGADRCSLFLVERDRSSGEKRLVSQLFDVTANCEGTAQQLEACRRERITLAFGKGILGTVAQSGCPLNIADAYQDPRFSEEVDRLTGYHTKSILCMPITNPEGEVIGVAQAVNKLPFSICKSNDAAISSSLPASPSIFQTTSSENHVVDLSSDIFSDKDQQVFASYMAFCGVGLRNAELFRNSQLETRRNQVLLDLARIIFEEQSNLSQLIYKIMRHTQCLLACERCQVLLVEDPETSKGIFSRVFDFCASDVDNDEAEQRVINDEPRFPINIGITGFVAKSGETVNIVDAYEDERFDKTVDEECAGDFRTRAILCMAIKNAEHHVVGVAQLVNKISGGAFTEADRNLFEAFALFCGLGIHNTQMYEKTLTASAKQRVALEVLSYHAISPAEEAAKLKKQLVPSVRYFKLRDFAFSDFKLTDDDTLLACLRMFIDLGLLERFRISYEVLCRWLLSVRKNYRNVTYHNWRHAFNVAQTMFSMVKSSAELQTSLNSLELLSLLIACLCHDLDHRGTNNQFQIRTMSPLAELYSTSVLEHHHFEQCIMILQTKGNDILSHLSPVEFTRVVELVESCILATDLAKYFARRGEFFNLVDNCTGEWQYREDHRELLRAMLMTACDVSAITKPWSVQRKIAELVASEFFEQGDIEKRELHIKPIDMMDRDKKDQLPSMQVGFIDTICMPIYQAMTKVSSTLSPLLEGCKLNRLHWQNLASSNNVDIV